MSFMAFMSAASIVRRRPERNIRFPQERLICTQESGDASP
jgi:hypothetical protein